MIRKSLLSLTAFALAWCAVYAQEAPPAVVLQLSPAAEPSPPLKYSLLPEYVDRRDENAAVIYMRALVIRSEYPKDAATAEKMYEWVTMPIDKLPLEEVRKVVQANRTICDMLQSAARCDQCQWNFGERQAGKNLFAILLTETQQARDLGRLLALKARLQIAEKQYDEAIVTLQSGYALARHVSTQPFLVSGLVGSAIAAQMSAQVEALVAAPDAPNLYWALAALPRPLIDSRHALELEGSSLFMMYPELRDIEHKELTEDEWRALWRKYAIETVELMNLMGEGGAAEPAGDPKDITDIAKRALKIAMADALLEKKHAAARKSLIARGFPEKDVEKMPKQQVVIVDEVLNFKAVRDDYLRWTHLPYWQARDGLAKADAALAARTKLRDKKKPEELRIVDLLLPAIGRLMEAFNSADQRLDALQTIEAVRMHAAAHDGKLPRTLDEITIVPVPVNPFTGKLPEYKYSMDTGSATLKFWNSLKERELTYELKVR